MASALSLLAPHRAVRLHVWYRPPSRLPWHCSDQYGSQIHRLSSPESSNISEEYREMDEDRRWRGLQKRASRSCSIYPMIPTLEEGNSVFSVLFPKLSQPVWQFVIYRVLLEFKRWPGLCENPFPSLPQPSLSLSEEKCFFLHSVSSQKINCSRTTSYHRLRKEAWRGQREYSRIFCLWRSSKSRVLAYL